MDVLDDGLRRDIASRDAGQPEPAYDALVQAFANAPSRTPLW
jgi:hypothetical protein